MSVATEGGGCGDATRGGRGSAPVKSGSKQSSTKGKPARSVSLSVVGVSNADARKPITMGSSKMGKWRTLVLVLVHVFIAIHIVQWIITGMTVSPVEPSEAMYTLEVGKVNAGFVFFTVAILSTFIFGRFFCGWACHVVALQDACAWVMNKVGVRPKPFRSRLMIFAPLALGLYMFVWPTLDRLLIEPAMRPFENFARIIEPVGAGVGDSALGRLGAWGITMMAHDIPEFLEHRQPFPGFKNAFIVEDFWATFPPWYIAIPFLAVCGFATVYFLGAKGFCTYGCPYGGIFAPVDRVAIGRIVVNDSCHQCGHCTAVCTSNVRVHQEVRDYGMVVDPGCMKCMDCVSVCPNDALSFGFATPAAFVKPRTAEARAGKVRRPDYDFTINEEVFFAGVMVVLFFAFRSMLNQVPLLMAGALAAIGTYAAWKLWRLARDPHVRMQNVQLKHRGRLKAAGVAFVAVGGAYLAAGAWSAVVRYNLVRGDLIDSRVQVPFEVVFSPGYKPAPKDLANAERAIAYIERGGAWRDGGIGWKHAPNVMVRLSWLHAVAGDLKASDRVMWRALTESPKPNPSWAFQLAEVRSRQGATPSDIRAMYGEILDIKPELYPVRLVAGYMDVKMGKPAAAVVAAQAVSDAGRAAEAIDHVRAGELMVEAGQPAKALEVLDRGIALRPKAAELHASRAMVQYMRGNPAETLKGLEKAADLDRGNILYKRRLAELYGQMGRPGDAARVRAEADKLSRAAR